MRVLLVDDEQELVATLAERLEMRGIEAAWAVDWPSALAALEKQQFDIALLDVACRRSLALKGATMLNQELTFYFQSTHYIIILLMPG